MKVCDFQIRSHAKWILAGEHAVLRNHPALVFPIPSKFITLSYWDQPDEATVDFHAPYGETLLLFFWGVISTALKLLGKQRSDIKGRFLLENNIPMGAGMGFSAAFCVAITQWFVWKGWLDASEVFNFARHLEDGFHGKSSGVDIIGALSDHGIRFTMQGEFTPLKTAWQPALYLSYSDQVSVTAQCIQRVNILWENQAKLAEQIDQEMHATVEQAEQALLQKPAVGMNLLADAINQANTCFERWGLVTGNLQHHLQQLREHGALAVKPTGAGDGGYVLSLWDKVPHTRLPFEMIPAF